MKVTQGIKDNEDGLLAEILPSRIPLEFHDRKSPHLSAGKHVCFEELSVMESVLQNPPHPLLRTRDRILNAARELFASKDLKVRLRRRSPVVPG